MSKSEGKNIFMNWCEDKGASLKPFVCTVEEYSGKKTDCRVFADTAERARKKLIEQSPKCYVSPAVTLKEYNDSKADTQAQDSNEETPDDENEPSLEEDKKGATEMNVREGDICVLDEKYSFHFAHPPYKVLVLWNGVNSQPLVTKLDEYKPFWTTYSQLVRVEKHIDCDEVLSHIVNEKK